MHKNTILNISSSLNISEDTTNTRVMDWIWNVIQNLMCWRLCTNTAIFNTQFSIFNTQRIRFWGALFHQLITPWMILGLKLVGLVGSDGNFRGIWLRVTGHWGPVLWDYTLSRWCPPSLGAQSGQLSSTTPSAIFLIHHKPNSNGLRNLWNRELK